MSQNFDVYVLVFHDYFSRFRKIKTRAYIKILRHCSFHTNVFHQNVKFYAWEIKCNIRGDILVQKT